MLSKAGVGLVLLVVWQASQPGLRAPEWAILQRASEALEEGEGISLGVGGVVTAPPLMPEQLGIGSATWTEPPEAGARAPAIRLSVLMFAISTPEAAARFFADRENLEPYELGDQAALATNDALTSYSIYVRKGRFLAFVSGDRADAELVARYVVQAMDDAE